ncbi:hypothetical protein CUJ83_09480 [Methanocella sp. CWC-04]|uniref:Carboxypeptidase regulatory-like domain-containing protein n=1 Tax=Methanooceanicella nereidis TaxID=2052831 RepID=A0AAP2W6D4_9EURY|nr:hypothetical protein [Methanocella sp. CWC-04]MCD1295228.1 hypothetical protein [Methanocella sp. CWC-04]
MKDTGGVPEDVTVAVSILNSSVPEDYFYANTTVDMDGNFVFINLPSGEYKVYLYGDHVAYGYSNRLVVSNDSTSSCAILVRPRPYGVNIHAKPISLSYSDAKTNVTITVYDHYGDKVGAGWFITTYTNSGYTDMPYGYTDKNGMFTTILRSAPFEMYKEIKAFRLNDDGQYYAMSATYTEKFDDG